MTENAVVRARIDAEVKEEAATVLAAMGLTVSDAFRMLMVKIARERQLPFEPLVPNEQTVEAMRASREGHVTEVPSSAELLSRLNAQD